MPHAAIIGAGPAGSSAAISLLARGWDVTLIESKPFPRIKVCGEFISPAATHLLERLIPPAELLAAGARRVHDLILEFGDRQARWPMPTGDNGAWAISRATLDTLLLARARAAGARTLHPDRVTAAHYHDDHIQLTLASGGCLRADIAIHADGAGRHDPAGPVPSRCGVVGVKCHFRPAEPLPGIRMRSAPGAYIGTVAVEPGADATCAAVLRSDILTHFRGDIDAAIADRWPAWDPARRTTDWLACGVPGSPYIHPGHPRSFRVGNAAAAVEPVGGEGIGLALWAGAALTQTLPPASPVITTPDLVQSQRRLAAAYRRRTRLRRAACRAVAELLMRPTLVRAAWPTLRIPSLSVRPWYILTGKPARPAVAGSNAAAT